MVKLNSAGPNNVVARKLSHMVHNQKLNKRGNRWKRMNIV